MTNGEQTTNVTERKKRNEGDYFSGRQRDAAVSFDDGDVEATFADLRQADDFLSAVDFDARGDPRNFNHLDAAGFTEFRATLGRRLALRTFFVVQSAAVAGRIGASFPLGRGIYRRRRVRDDFGRQYFLRRRSETIFETRRLADKWRDGLRLLRGRPGALRRDCLRRERESRFHRRKAAASEIKLRRDGSLFLRPKRVRVCQTRQTVGTRRIGNHRSQPNVSGKRKLKCGDAGSRLRLAGHRHDGFFV